MKTSEKIIYGLTALSFALLALVFGVLLSGPEWYTGWDAGSVKNAPSVLYDLAGAAAFALNIVCVFLSLLCALRAVTESAEKGPARTFARVCLGLYPAMLVFSLTGSLAGFARYCATPFLMLAACFL